MQLPVYEVSLVVIRYKEFDHVDGDVDCNHDCSCRVTVCITDDFHCVKLGDKEHQQHPRRGSRH